MSEKNNGKFNYRAFVSVLSGFTFAVMAVTGLVMFFAPSCRIARDTGWTVWGYDKEQWAGVHVWFSIAFVLASVLHIYLNWAALTSYFKNKLRRGLALRAEWVAALAICAVIGLGTIYEVAPFSTLVAYKESFKHSESGIGAGGQGWRGGRAALQQGQSHFASPVMISSSSCAMQSAGAKGGTESTCGQTEQLQSPTQEQPPGGLCEKEQAQPAAASISRIGMGQKTLKQFCSDEGIALSWALSRLKDQGFTARETMTMREIADSAGVHPRELRNVLQPE